MAKVRDPSVAVIRERLRVRLARGTSCFTHVPAIFWGTLAQVSELWEVMFEIATGFAIPELAELANRDSTAIEMTRLQNCMF